jgi:glycosidase
MLHFLENHDEQRIASPAFAGDADKAKPAMVVSALLGRSPTMIYFGQEVGEAGDGDAGFGDPTRTTIFDYWGVPSHQRWMNAGKFDGGALSAEEKSLRDFYRRLLNFSAASSAANGAYAEIHGYNRTQGATAYNERVFSFVRWSNTEKLIVLSNFSAEQQNLEVYLPQNIIREWSLSDGRIRLDDQLSDHKRNEMVVADARGFFSLSLEPFESVVYRLGGPLQ